MHEASMGQELADIVCRHLESAQWNPALERIASVNVRVGVMSGVEPQALQSAFQAAAVGTVIQGASLQIDSADLVVWCSACQQEQVLHDIRRLACPICSTPTPKVLRGKELEVASIEVIDAAANS
jgi:hydrogenase nickel incorporation protein HypA/HybF